MKTRLLFMLAVLTAIFTIPIQNAFGYEIKAQAESEESFVAKPCTVIITGNLHTRRSGCTTGIGSCIKIVIRAPKLPFPLPTDIILGHDGGEEERVDGNAILSFNPKEPEQAVVDFILLDDEQMKEDTWDLEEDFVIDDPELSDEFDGVKSITLLKDNYKIDRSENKVGRSFVRCRIN